MYNTGMKTEIKIRCPKCGSDKIVKNGLKANGKQLYKCRDCNRQFIADHDKVYKGTLSNIANQIKLMLVRGSGVRDISVILSVSVYKILSVLTKSSYEISPKKNTMRT